MRRIERLFEGPCSTLPRFGGAFLYVRQVSRCSWVLGTLLCGAKGLPGLPPHGLAGGVLQLEPVAATGRISSASRWPDFSVKNGRVAVLRANDSTTSA